MVGISLRPGSNFFDNFDKVDDKFANAGSIDPWAKRHKPSWSAAKTPRTSDFSSLCSSLSISDLKSDKKFREINVGLESRKCFFFVKYCLDLGYYVYFTWNQGPRRKAQCAYFGSKESWIEKSADYFGRGKLFAF